MYSIDSSKLGLMIGVILCPLNLPSITLLSLAISNMNIGSMFICLITCAGLIEQITLTTRCLRPTLQSKTLPRQLVIPVSPVSACNAKLPSARMYLTLGRLSNSQSSKPSQCSSSGRLTGFLASSLEDNDTCLLTTFVQ